MTIEMTTSGSLNHLTFAEYRSWLGVSQSDLKACWRDPQLYAETKQGIWPVTEPSPAQLWGTGMEEYLRTGGAASNCVLIPREVLSDQGHRRGKAWQEFAAKHEGKRLLTPDEYEAIYGGYERAMQNIEQHEAARAILASPTKQWSQRFAWRCSETGLLLKAELDLIDLEEQDGELGGWIVDVKTATSNDIDAFSRDIINYGYDVQAAMYLEAAATQYPAATFDYGWIVIKNRPPYSVEVFTASAAFCEAARERLSKLKRFYRQCHESGVWRHNSYGTARIITPPSYAAIN